MSGHRQAAAALYGLAKTDQDGILRELDERDQRILRTYLAELCELGFDSAGSAAPASAAVQDAPDNALAESPAQPPSTSAAPSVPDRRACLRVAAASQVFAAVAQEPAALIAQLLALEAWPWAEAMLGMLPSPRSTQVQIAIDAGVRAAPARALFLVDAVSARLGERRPAAAGARLKHLPRAMKKWMSWTR